MFYLVVNGSELETTNMSDEVNKDWSHWIREADEPATIARMGARIAKQEPVKAGGVTKVDQSPQIKDAKAMKDDQNTKGYDKGNRPNDAQNRPGHIEQAKQPYSPSNPQSRFVDRWSKAGLDQSTRAAQSRQSGNYLNRKS
jgi:hypothetical protein